MTRKGHAIPKNHRLLSYGPRLLPETIFRLGRGAFFIPLTACIVTLRAGLSKSFLRCPRLRNWGAVNKNKYAMSESPRGTTKI